MKPQRFFQALLATISVTFLSYALQLLSGQVMDISVILWNLLANFLVVSVLGFYAISSTFPTRQLILATGTIFYIIGNFNIIIEAVIFGVVDSSYMLRTVLFGVPYSFMAGFLVVWIFKGLNGKPQFLLDFDPRKKSSWMGRVLGANFIYIFFYVIAGMLIQHYTPGFSEFYEGKLPSPAVFFMTNVFFRGFVFVGIAVLIDRTLHGTRLTKAVYVGLVFSILGGIAPLIPPNEAMPQFIRIAHGIEVGISNFLYGVCVLLIVGSKVTKSMDRNVSNTTVMA